MRKANILVSLTFVFALLMIQNALATCPVCIVTVVGGLELAKWLGLDDTVSGVWIGGLILASAIWFENWLEKKRIKFRFSKIVIVVLFYLSTVISLYWMKLIGYECAKIWGVDKLLVGIAAGSIAFYAGMLLNDALKKRNGGRVYFKFQKVIIPVLFLLISSIIFYLITRC